MMLPTRCDIFCLQGCQKSRNLRAEKNGTSSIRFSSALGYLCGRGWLHSSLLSHKLLQGAKAEKDRSQGANSLQHLCPSCCLASDQQDLHLHSPPPPHASSFEMLTGTNLIFVSILFIKKSLAWYSWFAILVISIDVVVVGISDMKSVFLVPALRAVLRQCSDVVA